VVGYHRTNTTTAVFYTVFTGDRHGDQSRDSELRTMVTGHSELGVAATTKAVWLDLHLASLLTHLFVILFCFFLFVWLRISQRQKKVGA